MRLQHGECDAATARTSCESHYNSFVVNLLVGAGAAHPTRPRRIVCQTRCAGLGQWRRTIAQRASGRYARGNRRATSPSRNAATAPQPRIGRFRGHTAGVAVRSWADCRELRELAQNGIEGRLHDADEGRPRSATSRKPPACRSRRPPARLRAGAISRATTRERVVAAARELGYDRSRSTRGRPTTLDPRLIEFVLGSFDDAWTDAMTDGAREAAFRLGFDLVLTLERPDPSDDWPTRVATRRPSGVVIGIIRPTHAAARRDPRDCGSRRAARATIRPGGRAAECRHDGLARRLRRRRASAAVRGTSASSS